jgi:hypothetical protein
MTFSDRIGALFKDMTAGDVHVSSAGEGKKKRPKFGAIVGDSENVGGRKIPAAPAMNAAPGAMRVLPITKPTAAAMVEEPGKTQQPGFGKGADGGYTLDADVAQSLHDLACALGAECGATAKRFEIEATFHVAKADPDRHEIFGWASVVEENGALIVDKQGDVIMPADLEKAAYDYVLHARDHGFMHLEKGTGRLIESMVFTREKQAALGVDLGQVGWWVGFHIDDPDVWAAHKRGDLPEFSIGGRGKRVDL